MAFATQIASAATLPSGCGPDAMQYKVKTERAPAGTDAVAADKARLIFLQTLDGDFSSAPISRFAVDGAWVGAAKGSSYVELEVSPGTHQICAARQSGAKREPTEAGSLSAQVQAGQTYVYQFNLKLVSMGSPEMRAGSTGVPGTSMTAKEPETTESAELTASSAAALGALLQKAPKAVSVVK